MCTFPFRCFFLFFVFMFVCLVVVPCFFVSVWLSSFVDSLLLLCVSFVRVFVFCCYGGLRPPGPRRPFGSTKKHNITTKSSSYNRFGNILFQKVVLGHELPFVQPGSSKNVLKQLFVHKHFKKLNKWRHPPPPSLLSP